MAEMGPRGADFGGVHFFYFKCKFNILLDGISSRGKRQIVEHELNFIFSGGWGPNFFFKRVLYAENGRIFFELVTIVLYSLKY